MTSSLTRRGLLAGGAALGLAACARPSSATAASVETGGPVVFRGATVLPMTGDAVWEATDVLVRDGVVAEIGRGLGGGTEIDASGAILMPGMVDVHRHCWQAPFAGLGADWDFAAFTQVTQGGIVPRYRPEDFHAAALLSHLDALDAGVTTVVDYNHGLVEPADAEASLRAATESGARVRYAWGHAAMQANDPARSWYTAVEPLLARRTDLVDVALALDWSSDPALPERAAWEFAARENLQVTAHSGLYGRGTDAFIDALRNTGRLRSGTLYVHAGAFGDSSYRAIRDSGGAMAICTESEFTFGQGRPATKQVARYGIGAGLGSDTVVYESADLLTAMRSTLNADRLRANTEAQQANAPLPAPQLTAAQVLEWGTVGGARALGLADRIGTVEVGKRADLVLLRPRSPLGGLALANHPAAAVVLHASRADVDTVLVDGRIVKRDGTLVADLAAAQRAATDTRAHVLADLDLAAARRGRT
ncbi:amidohydrolase family protein [Pseudonocardia pini]|uniref:amidohydrolase family protein n=1 Tax=Pseudonocardia pini TaxID=2758030 RepID=UPI0015F032C0|nr:amidohydrolase family protein [Pseudonocardia pini]